MRSLSLKSTVSSPALVLLVPDLHNTGLDILVTTLGRDRANAAIRIDHVSLNTDIGCGVSIKLLALGDVEVDWECPCNNEESQWDNECDACTGFICYVAENNLDTISKRTPIF